MLIVTQPQSSCFLLFFFSQLFVRPPQKAILLFCISFSWGWSWSLSPVQSHEPLSTDHQTLYQIYSLKSISHFHCMIIRDFIWVILEWSRGFPYFLQFNSDCNELLNKEFMIWATVNSWSCFCWLYRASPSLAAKNIISLISVFTIWWCPCVYKVLFVPSKSLFPSPV